MSGKVEEKSEVKKNVLKTEGEKIWEQIKDLPLSIFGLQNQKVHHHCEPVFLDPNSLHLKLKSAAVVASLDYTLNGGDLLGLSSKENNFSLELIDGGFLLLKRIQTVKLP